MKIYELEEKIMSVWNTVNDIELLTRQQFDSDKPMSEDDIMNTMIGISTLHHLRCADLFDAYEQCIQLLHDEKSVSDWLGDCPEVALGRVIVDVEDLKFIMTTEHLYDENTLVVTPVKTLKEL